MNRSGVALTIAVMLTAACGAGDAETGDIRGLDDEPTAGSIAASDVADRGTTDDGLEDGDIADQTAATRQLFAELADDEPGCSAAVNVDGEIVFAEAWGAAVLDPVEPFTSATIVDIASTSKQFTAIAIGQLILDGDVALDDSLADYVDRLPTWADDVTVAQLIVHTSGIPDYIELLSDAGVGDDDTPDQADALDALLDVELDADPGTVFEYSNSNYVLLAEIVEAVTGDDLTGYLDAEVFGPRDIDASMTPAAEIDGKAVSYEFDGDWVIADSQWRQIGDGAVHTTPTELARFASFYWEDTERAQQFAALRDEIAVDGGDSTLYSLGIIESDADGLTVLFHDGAWSGFETAFFVVPERRVAVTYTCNSPDVELPDDIDEQLFALWLT